MYKKLSFILIISLCLLGFTQGIFPQSISPPVSSFLGDTTTTNVTVPDTIDLAEMDSQAGVQVTCWRLIL